MTQQERLKEVKEQLALNIREVAEWRRGEAEECPEDAERNNKAAKALEDLHEYIQNLPENHPFFYIQQQALDSTEDVIILATEEEELIKKYGFESINDPEKFIIELEGLYLGKTLDSMYIE